MEIAWIISIVAGGLFLIAAGSLFFVSRKSQKVMDSLLELLTRPERAKIADASRVLQTMLSGEMQTIENNFKTISDTLEAQIQAAESMRKNLGQQNNDLVGIAEDAVKKIANTSQRLENTVGGLQKIVKSKEWETLERANDKFADGVQELLKQIENTSLETIEKTRNLQSTIDGWIDSGKTLNNQLQSDLEGNASRMNSMVIESEALQQKLGELSGSVADGFANIKKEAANYEDTMAANDKLLGKQLEKMDAFTKQSKKLLTYQLNTLTSTANAVGSQIRLAESSIEKQEKGLAATTENLMNSSQATEGFIKSIATEVSGLAGKFQTELRDFASGASTELNAVAGVANTTLNDTKQAAGAFSESVRAMTQGVRETLMEMNAAYTQLTGQSQELVKISNDTTEQLRPLSELIEKYYSALPDLTRGSSEMTATLSVEISKLDEKIRDLASALEKSIVGMADSSLKLEHLSGQSRQQMIDLLSDYAKATDTMQTLNRQMLEARAAAPMQAIAKVASTPIPAAAKLAPSDFIKFSESIMEKLHELSVDLTRATGAQIPAAVWNKYNAGDKTIFSKWFAKMLGAADKRKIRDMLKNDAVFRSQATQFVRGFAKMMAGAEQTENRDMVSATLLKTDLGQMYLALKANV